MIGLLEGDARSLDYRSYIYIYICIHIYIHICT